MAYRKLFSRIIAAGFAVSFATIVACSSGGTKTVIVVPAEGGTESSSGAPGTAAQCKTTATFLECLVCCGPDQAYLDAQNAFNSCRCDTCKDACASGGGCDAPDAASVTQACITCLESDATGQTCFPAADKICNADAQCTAFQQCNLDADCTNKPDDNADGG